MQYIKQIRHQTTRRSIQREESNNKYNATVTVSRHELACSWINLRSVDDMMMMITIYTAEL